MITPALAFRILISIAGVLIGVSFVSLLRHFSFKRYWEIVQSRQSTPQTWWIRFYPVVLFITVGALLREYTPLICYAVPTTQELIGSVLLLIGSIVFVVNPVDLTDAGEFTSDMVEEADSDAW